MDISTNLNAWVVHILLLPLCAVSHIYKPTVSTTEFIGCEDSRFYNITHTRYHYEVPLNSSVQLPSCGARKNNFSMYWFVYTDFCDVKESANFAIVDFDGVANCMNRSLLISYDSCRINYIFTNESMTIINMTDATPKEYICFYGKDTLNLQYPSAVSHLVRILDSSNEYTASVSTSFSESLSSETIATMSTSDITLASSSASSSETTLTTITTETPSKSWILQIVLPSVIGVIIVIAVSVIGFVWYQRRRQHQQEPAIKLRILT